MFPTVLSRKETKNKYYRVTFPCLNFFTALKNFEKFRIFGKILMNFFLMRILSKLLEEFRILLEFLEEFRILSDFFFFEIMKNLKISDELGIFRRIFNLITQSATDD